MLSIEIFMPSERKIQCFTHVQNVIIAV